MKKVYKSGVSWGLLGFLYLVFGLVIFLLSYQSKWIGLAFSLPLMIFVTHMFLSTRYTIKDDDVLIIQSGFLFHQKIPIQKIIKLQDTSSILSSPAASLKGRIEIKYNKWDIVIISPKDKQNFIDHLLRINPEIAVKIKPVSA